MKVIVISLGGSVFIPNYVDYNFLDKFRELVLQLKNYKFVIVLGGGGIARKYLKPMKKKRLDVNERSRFGFEATRLNALFLMKYFGKIANEDNPKSMKEVKNLLRKNKVVVCGGLRFAKKSTSDGTAAKLANYLGTEFVNLTDVDGLFSKDPNKFKDAKLVSSINYDDFYSILNKIKYKPGQHFVLDQLASRIIRKHNIRTVILNGHRLKNFESYLKGKKFRGTVICKS